MSDRRITVLIVDDHAIVRRGLRALLSTEPDIEIVGEAENGARAVDLALEVEPDVVLMDLVMPVMDGTEAILRIRARQRGIRILVLTSFGTDRKLLPAVKAGANGYLLKDAAAEDLVRSIRQIAAGQAPVDPVVARRLLREIARDSPPRPPVECLTVREIEVLRLLARGLANEGIADDLSISEATVRTHVSNILAKLRLDNRTQAALHALREGLAALEEESN